MVATALKEKAMDYFSMLDDNQAQIVISYMESFESTHEKKEKKLSDLKGKIRFSDNYDYKSMRNTL